MGEGKMGEDLLADRIFPHEVLRALREDGSEEDSDMRMLQLDIGVALNFLSPNDRCLILLYSAGYSPKEAMRQLFIRDTHYSQFFIRTVKRLTDVLNGRVK